MTTDVANRIISALNAACNENRPDKIYPLASYLLNSPFKDELTPGHRSAIANMLHNTAFHMMYAAGDTRMGFLCADAAFRVSPEPFIHNQMVLAALAHGEYDAAWSRASWRAVATRMGHWNGDPCDTLYIHNSNGLGDFLQFCRFVPETTRHCRRVLMGVPDRLRGLIRSTPAFAGVELVGRDEVPADAATCEVWYLPLPLGITKAGLVPPGQYLFPDPDKERRWRAIVRETDDLHVGLIWGGRSLADGRGVGLAQFQELFNRPGIQIVGLQNNVCREEMFGLNLPGNFRDFGVYDLESLPCIMRCMDVILAPDCGPCHMACALGVPTMVMLAPNCDWRWRSPSERTPWYANATLFHRRVDDEWSDVIARVTDRLDRMVADRSRAPSPLRLPPPQPSTKLRK
jgi:hypothetical protein